MNALKLVRKWRRLSWAEQKLTVEASLDLVISYMLVKLVPFRYIEPHLGQSNLESTYDSDPMPADVKSIARVISRIHRYASPTATCLMEAVTVKMMLNRRHISNTLYLGVLLAVSGDNPAEIKAHAWLRTGDLIITGRQGHARFKPIALYSSLFG